MHSTITTVCILSFDNNANCKQFTLALTVRHKIEQVFCTYFKIENESKKVILMCKICHFHYTEA